MNNGWVKLYRKINENPVLGDTNASQIFLWLLVNVDKDTGSVKIGRIWLSKLLGIKESTLYKALKRLQRVYKVVTQVSNNRYTEITLLNWAKYQSTQDKVTQASNSEGTAKEQRRNTLQELRIENKEYKREEKYPLEYLSTFPLEDFADIEATEKQIRLEAEKASNWLRANGQKKKDHKAFLRNWVLKVYKKRAASEPNKAEEYTIDEHGLARLREITKDFKLKRMN